MALPFLCLIFDGSMAAYTDTCDLTGVWTGSFKKHPLTTHGVYNISQNGNVWNASSGGTEGWKTAGGVVQADRLINASFQGEKHPVFLQGFVASANSSSGRKDCTTIYWWVFLPSILIHIFLTVIKHHRDNDSIWCKVGSDASGLSGAGSNERWYMVFFG